MKKFSLQCNCGQVMSVDANSQDDAVLKMKQMMDQNMLDTHWTQYHQSDTNPKPTLAQAHMRIESDLKEVISAAPM